MRLVRGLFRKDHERPPDAHVWIGLDFGTATTECVVRLEVAGTPDRVMVMAFDGSARSDARIVLPSAIEVTERSVMPAYSLTGTGRSLEMLKTAIVGEIDRGLEDHALRRSNGPFAWAMLHLAFVLAKTRSALTAWLGGKQLRFYLNIAAPVGADPNNQRFVRIREVFRELGFRALVVSSITPAAPPTLSRANECIARGLSAPVPEPHLSPVLAVPEALAAVTSFLHAPDRSEGNYATIDVGGGTTDISFFWFQTGRFDEAAERKAWYYAASTYPVGTSDLIRILGLDVSSRQGRTTHERLRDLVKHTDPALTDGADAFLRKLNDCYTRSFRESFALRPSFREWAKNGSTASWALLLLGGGCGIPFVREQLQVSPPQRCNFVEHGGVEVLSAPRHLDILTASGKVVPAARTRRWNSERDVLDEVGHLATVAHGLAYRAPDIPKYGTEERVAPLAPAPGWEPPPHIVHA